MMYLISLILNCGGGFTLGSFLPSYYITLSRILVLDEFWFYGEQYYVISILQFFKSKHIV